MIAPKARTTLAIGLFSSAILFIAIIDTWAKYLTRDLHPVQITWGYFLAIATYLVLWALAVPGARRYAFRTRRPVMHMARAFLLVASIAALYVALVHLPIAEATAISFTSPLFMVALAALLLGEPVDRHRWGAVIVGLSGVLVIVRPGGEFAHWSALMPLVTAVTMALFQIATRALAASERTFTMLFFTGLGGLFWCSLAVPFFWRPLEAADYGVFMALGAFGVAAHLCLIGAFQRAEASTLAPFNYTKMVWVAVGGWLVFGDSPGVATWLGSLIIIASTLYVLRRERRGAAGGQSNGRKSRPPPLP